VLGRNGDFTPHPLSYLTLKFLSVLDDIKMTFEKSAEAVPPVQLLVNKGE